MPTARGRGRGRPPKLNPILRDKDTEAPSKPKRRDREGIDATNILETKRERLASKKKMKSLEDHSPVEEEGDAEVTKKGRIIFDLDYIESSLPSSPILKSTKAAKAMAVVKATTIMKSKKNMKVSRKANESIPLKALDEFITVMLSHIQCPNLNPNSWPQNLLHRTTADKVKTQYPLDSNALWSKLKDEYFEEYKRKGVLAHATIYLTPQFLRDLQFTLKQRKPSKPTGAIQNSGKKGNELLTNLDNPDGGVETTNDITDAAVGFMGTVKPQAIALQAALKCVDHPGVHCHRDKQGNHHTMNFLQRRIWIKALEMAAPGVTVYSPPRDPACAQYTPHVYAATIVWAAA
ncbi:hypothetical protein K439DRAFT_1611805 [Ramaria rubella]|nr:hypothetical protein K439DRAFT_1611805 [Ramaria rubella]